MPDPGEHYRPVDTHEEPGVYRVVGTSGDVTLLRVADGDGRRVHVGAVHRVDPEALIEAYEPAVNPDAGFDPVSTVREILDGLYWSVRRFV